MGLGITDAIRHHQHILQLEHKFRSEDNADRLRCVTTVGHWEAFMHSAGSGMPLRQYPRAAIRVQPTSVSRRMPGVS